jgi:superoxide oxidase
MIENNFPIVTKFNPVLIFLHWLMVVLIVAVYICMETRGFFPRDSDPRNLLKNLHFMLGIAVLLMVVVRIAVRLATQIPDTIPAPKPLEKIAANIMRVTLYIFMLFMPILGWLTLSAYGKPIPFFGFELPPLIEKNAGLRDILKAIHEIGASIGYVLLGGHAVAGLFHHYIKKDNTMQRMSFFKN